MADIPPIHASAVQAGFQARESGQARDARRNEQAQAANQQIKSVTDATGIVDTMDADNQVFADSEGAGSQGRSFEDPPTDDDQPGDDAGGKHEGLTKDESGTLHIDLEA